MPVIPAEEAEAGFKHGLHIKPCVKKPKPTTAKKKKKRSSCNQVSLSKVLDVLMGLNVTLGTGRRRGGRGETDRICMGVSVLS
jgi:hypothetical protein